MKETIEFLKEMVSKVKKSIPELLEYSFYTVRGPKNKNKLMFYETFEKEDFNIGSDIKDLYKKLNQLLDHESRDTYRCDKII